MEEIRIKGTISDYGGRLRIHIQQNKIINNSLVFNAKIRDKLRLENVEEVEIIIRRIESDNANN